MYEVGGDVLFPFIVDFGICPTELRVRVDVSVGIFEDLRAMALLGHHVIICRKSLRDKPTEIKTLPVQILIASQIVVGNLHLID
jgi:hypothetical protein